MIRIKKDRSAVIPDTERHIGFENDHLIETRLFCIEDTALADFTFKLDIENTDVVSLTPVAASEAAVSGMLLEWPVTRDALGSGGLICAQLRAFDADGNRVWHSEKMEFTAGESVHTAANASDPATITEFEQIEKKVTQALASMDAVYDDVTGKYSEIVQMGEDYTAAMKAVDTLSEQAGAHYADKANPHEVTAEQVGAYTKTETDGKISEAVAPVESDVTALEGAVSGKLDKVSSYVRVYPGVYATIETDGTPHLITATSDLGYIGNTAANQYLPLYAAGGQLKTATPTAADSAANKGYVDGKIAEAVAPVEDAVAGKLDKVTESYPVNRVYGVSMAGGQITLGANSEFNTPGYIPVYNEDGVIATGTPKKDTDSVNKKYADEKAAEKLDKVSSYVRIYPGVYATNDTDGTPYLITATSDLGYIGNSRGYIPLYETGGQLKTATPTADDSAANKGYVDGKIAALTNKYELIETITLTEATSSIERSVEPDGTAYNFKKLIIYMNASLTNKTGAFGVNLWDGTTLAAQHVAFGSDMTQTKSDYIMEISVEDGILHQTTPARTDYSYLASPTKTAAVTFYGGVKMMDKISKIQINQYNGIAFTVGTVIKIYGVRA